MSNWLQQQNEIREDYSTEETYERKPNPCRDCLCHKTVLGWAIVVAVALVPLAVYFLVVDEGDFSREESYTCLVNKTFRVPCGRRNFTEKECLSAYCCFDVKVQRCYHSVPSRYYYQSDGDSFTASHRLTPLGTPSTRKLSITVDETGADQVRIILHDAAEHSVSGAKLQQKNYEVVQQDNKLQVEVFRKGGGRERLLSTANGPLLASDHYWEWTLYMTNHSLFGLNRTLITFQDNATSITKFLYNNKRDHSSAPLFWAYYEGKFHGVRIEHEGPLEVEILRSYLVVLRSLAGGAVELVLSVGPTPRQVHDQQATAAVPDAWMLGTHVCRSSDNRNVTEVMQDFTIDDYADSYCIDENIFTALVADNSTSLNIIEDTLTSLKEKGKKFLLSLPPQLPVDSGTLYSKAVSLDVLYRRKGKIYEGKYRGTTVVYPDFSHSRIGEYLEEFDKFLKRYITVDIDGFVLKDNWPVDDSYVMGDNSSFPYFTEEMQEAMSWTVPWDATSRNATHLRRHNSYGSRHTEAFRARYDRSAVSSSAKLVGHASPAAALQNVNATWGGLADSIDHVLFDSVTGNHLTGVPVCGDSPFWDPERQELLCLRWYLAAATMPFVRVASRPPYRDPAHLYSRFVEGAVERALDRRRALLGYYYTVLSRNEPLIRPTFYDHPGDPAAFGLRGQYKLGGALLVAHPLTEKRRKLRVYLPPEVGVWFEMWGGRPVACNASDPWEAVDVVDTDLVVFVAQGAVVPLKIDNEINLIVALNCTADPCQSEGTLLLNDDVVVSFKADNESVTLSNIPKTNCNYTLGHVKLYGGSYSDDQATYDRYYSKNESICDKGDIFTIVYRGATTTTTDAATTTTDAATTDLTTTTAETPTTTAATTTKSTTLVTTPTTTDAVTLTTTPSSSTAKTPTTTTDATTPTSTSAKTPTTTDATIDVTTPATTVTTTTTATTLSTTPTSSTGKTPTTTTDATDDVSSPVTTVITTPAATTPTSTSAKTPTTTDATIDVTTPATTVTTTTTATTLSTTPTSSTGKTPTTTTDATTKVTTVITPTNSATATNAP